MPKSTLKYSSCISAVKMSNFGTLICASGDTKTEMMKFEAGIQNIARVQNCPDITSLVSNGVSHRVGHEDGHGSVMGSGGRLSWLGYEVGSIVKQKIVLKFYSCTTHHHKGG